MPRAPVCPYYGSTKKEQIVCLRDGAGTFGSGELHMDFPSQVCRLRYWIRHCCGDWKACSLSPALSVEYEAHEARKDDKAAVACNNREDDKSIAVCYNKGSETVKRRSSARRNYNKWLTASGLRQIEVFAREGLEDERIAEKCGCAVKTIENWAKRYPQFAEALERGRQTR